MPIRAAINHVTEYRYDRPINLGPQTIRLRPAPHSRTAIPSYSFRVTPKTHFINWQQDPSGNWLARLVFPEKVTAFRIEVDLTADLSVINPFDFFIDPKAETFPFSYDEEMRGELSAYLAPEPAGEKLQAFLATVSGEPVRTVDFLVALNARLQQEITYLIRMEPGVQTPDQTLTNLSGSCRDSAWLLVQIMRNLGLAARFVSGYLIQLKADIDPIEGPLGTRHDFTDLHAWAEVYIPGAGWIGLDATSGLLCGEGHIPLAATPHYRSAAPVSGVLDPCEIEFHHSMEVTRVAEAPRITLPFSDEAWAALDQLGERIDADLAEQNVRLTMGGEPTFVSVDDFEAPEWNADALGPTKRVIADDLIRRLRTMFAPGGLLHYGQGKWYPGEILPRWAFGLYWRKDGQPIWTNPDLIAREKASRSAGIMDAEAFLRSIADRLGLGDRYVAPAYRGSGLLGDEGEYASAQRRRARSQTRHGRAAGPHRPHLRAGARHADGLCHAGPALVRHGPAMGEREVADPAQRDLPRVRATRRPAFACLSRSWPTFRRPASRIRRRRIRWSRARPCRLPTSSRGWWPAMPRARPETAEEDKQRRAASREIVPAAERKPEADGHGYDPEVRTALAIEPRDGVLCVFMPPGRHPGGLSRADRRDRSGGSVDRDRHPHRGLSATLRLRVLNVIKVTPDPGVIEVNIHPAANWKQAVHTTRELYAEARVDAARRRQVHDRRPPYRNGRRQPRRAWRHHAGRTRPSCGGPICSKSLLIYWQRHPALSYFFAGQYIGPTSQAPRVDEARHDGLYELEVAMAQVPDPAARNIQPWMVDRLFRNLLVDVTGNTHRAEICIDKLYSPDSATGRLGLIEFRGFEMPPDARMSLAQQLLLRGLVAWMWREPQGGGLVRWGTTLHDKFMLPHFIWSDLLEVLRDLGQCRL